MTRVGPSTPTLWGSVPPGESRDLPKKPPDAQAYRMVTTTTWAERASLGHRLMPPPTMRPPPRIHTITWRGMQPQGDRKQSWGRPQRQAWSPTCPPAAAQASTPLRAPWLPLPVSPAPVPPASALLMLRTSSRNSCAFPSTVSSQHSRHPRYWTPSAQYTQRRGPLARSLFQLPLTYLLSGEMQLLK